MDRFAWGTTTWVEELNGGIGGNGANTSYTLGKLGCPVKIYGIVGSDSKGEELLKILTCAAVDVAVVQRSARPTNSTVCVVNSAADRFFLHRLGCSTEFNADVLSFDGPDGRLYSHYHMANPFTLPDVRRQTGTILAAARAARKTTSVDTGWDAMGRWMQDVGPALPYTDLLFVNDLEAKMLTGHEDASIAAGRLRELGAREVLVKLGAGGSTLYTADATYHAEAFSVRAVDTTGAGDCYAGGFLAALHHGLGYEEALRVANAVGALNVSKLGAVAGVLGWQDTLDWIGTGGQPSAI